tara:strand:- start:2047 stop:2217 length:171 start_codon:yes stop_codon:yes gene_type:complete
MKLNKLIRVDEAIDILIEQFPDDGSIKETIEEIINALTGVLWDEEEAGEIKRFLEL